MIVSLYYADNTVNGKLYVGITSQNPHKRFSDHRSDARCPARGKNKMFANAMRKHGIANFAFHVIAVFDNRADANTAEIALIAKWNTRKPHGYNLTAGGDGVVGTTPWNKGLKLPDQPNKKGVMNKGQVPWNKGRVFLDPLVALDRSIAKIMRANYRRTKASFRRSIAAAERFERLQPEHIAAQRAKQIAATRAANVGHPRYKTHKFRQAVSDGMA